MKNWFNQYLSVEYLWTPVTETRFDLFYLVFSIALIVLPIVTKIFLAIKFKGRPKKVYEVFDKLWFWGFFTLGWLGLFIYFGRTQSLPIFGTRLVSYLFILSVLIIGIISLWYFRTKIPARLKGHFAKARKAKYLKNK